MKSILFLMTHQGYSPKIIEWLSSHPYIEIYQNNWAYDNYEKLLSLTSLPHKQKNSLAIYGDVLVRNDQLWCRENFMEFKFIYFFDDPQRILKNLMKEGLNLEEASRIYSYRLHGLYNYWLKNSGICINWEGKMVGDIKQYLNWEPPLFCLDKEAIISDRIERNYHSIWSAVQI